MKPLKVKDVVTLLEKIAPPSLAFEGDRIGLHIGSYNNDVHKVMVTLDVLENVVDEAVEKNVDFIVAHHPLIFNPLKSIDFNSEKGKIIKKLIEHNISVYVAHTNLDIAVNGVNDMLMKQLNINETDVLIETYNEPLFKLVLFVPTTHEDILRGAISDAGAGHIGEYSHCTFNSKGTGTFMPREGTNPYIGSLNELEKVSELRMETIVPERLLHEVIEAAKKAHPYEEMAYDVYPVKLNGDSYGLGRIGSLKKPMNLKDFAHYVKQSFDVPFVRMIGEEHTLVERVAVIGGDGNKYIHHARNKGADVLITGDVYFHTAQDALGIGLSMIDPGHHIEQIMKKELAVLLKEELKNDVEIIASEKSTEPFKIIY
ncbi:Nif3-like dinuclear metal center hexameric protein [Bacillaceae bacterium W0354]